MPYALVIDPDVYTARVELFDFERFARDKAQELGITHPLIVPLELGNDDRDTFAWLFEFASRFDPKQLLLRYFNRELTRTWRSKQGIRVAIEANAEDTQLLEHFLRLLTQFGTWDRWNSLMLSLMRALAHTKTAAL